MLSELMKADSQKASHNFDDINRDNDLASKRLYSLQGLFRKEVLFLVYNLFFNNLFLETVS